MITLHPGKTLTREEKKKEGKKRRTATSATGEVLKVNVP